MPTLREALYGSPPTNISPTNAASHRDYLLCIHLSLNGDLYNAGLTLTPEKVLERQAHNEFVRAEEAELRKRKSAAKQKATVASCARFTIMEMIHKKGNVVLSHIPPHLHKAAREEIRCLLYAGVLLKWAEGSEIYMRTEKPWAGYRPDELGRYASVKLT